MKSLSETPRCRRSPRPLRAFTLIELITVVGLLALCAMVAVPALCRTQPANRTLQCLGNMRGMIAAWQMYAQDNNDRMVSQIHGGSTMGGAGDPNYGVSWVSGWLDWSTGTDNTNTALFTIERYAKLAKYAKDPRIYQCPDDNYLSAPQIARGWTRRARSYSGNVYIGDGNASIGPISYIYRQARKTAELQYPPPAEAWVFTEEHPDSINDAEFFSPNAASQWVDIPSTFHNGAASFGFADGHVELHRWEGSLTTGAAIAVRNIFSSIGARVGDPDLHWVSYHTPRVSTSSY